ncbi:MAG: PKD domain-containing protein [Algoriphagus sp.]|nr:PKD domain-containing protein [Algoriphagus sp.]
MHLKHPIAKPIFFLIAWLISVSSFAQLSTVGKEFYVGFMENNRQPGKLDKAVIIVTANEDVSGIIRTPAADFPFQLKKGEQFIKEFDGTDQDLIHRTSEEVTNNKSAYIQASGKISVHAINQRETSSDGTVVLPVNALGKDYFVTAHFDVLNPLLVTGTPQNFESTLLVVAIEDDTKIEIVPSAKTIKNVAAGTPITITLNEGESYQIKANGDLTGSRVRVLNGVDGDCKNVAVYGGNKMTSAGDCGVTGDHLVHQSYPVSTWGKSFTHIPLAGRTSGEIVKILASEDGTQVRVNGQLVGTLNSGKFLKLEFGKDEIVSIETSKPASVASIAKSALCNVQSGFFSTFGDPSLMVYSPNNLRLKSLYFSSVKIPGIVEHFANVLVPKGSANQTILNGKNVGDKFKPVPGNDQFEYAQLVVKNGVNSLSNPEGFIAYAYGSGSVFSYGYAAGASFGNQIFETETTYDFEVEGEKIACLDQEGLWKIIPENTDYTDFSWNFGDGSSAVDGQEVSHTFTKEGTFKVTVSASAGSGRCLKEEEFVFEVEVKKIVAELVGAETVCPGSGEVIYALENTSNFLRAEWEVIGGVLKSQTDLTATIEWDFSASIASIKAIPYSENGCQGESLELSVQFTTSDLLELPVGQSGICGVQTEALTYKVPAPSAEGTYVWFVTGGEINSGQNTESVAILWDFDSPNRTVYYQESGIADSCPSNSELLTIETSPELQLETEQTAPSCAGEADGSISISPVGGSGNFEYSWSHDQSLKVNKAENLKAGTYEVTVKDLSGCTSIKIIEIEEPESLRINGQIAITPVSCSGGNDGGFEVAVLGGTAPYTIEGIESAWDGTSLSVKGLAEGKFSLFILDAKGCSIPVEGVINGAEPLAVNFIQESPGCPGGNNGELSVVVSGGLPPYNYSWGNGGIMVAAAGSKSTLSNSATISSMPSGEYAVTITDRTGCIVIAYGIIAETEPQVRMPTGFDPREGFFEPISNCSVSFKMNVFDRWGQSIYIGTAGWDGSARGTEVPPGAYFYIVEYSFQMEQKIEVQEIQGFVTLIR